MSRNTILGSLLVAFVVACGGSTTSTGSAGDGGAQNGASSGGNGSGNGNGDGNGSSGGSLNGVDGTLSPKCPPTAPADGTPCGNDSSIACEYGGQGVSLACSTIAVCSTEGAWSTRTPDQGCNGVQATNAPTCPASYASLAAGDACPTNLQSACAYPEGLCECASCASPDAGANGPIKAWSCARWPAPEGCPTPRPRAGSACATEGQSCNYTNYCSAVSLGLPDLVCKDGQWHEGQSFPPPCAFPQCGQ